MNAVVLLDLYGECRTLNATHTHVGSLNEALQQCTGKPAHLLTDWGSGALFGIATVVGTPSTAAALLEKQLRDQGETDDISHILVHQSQARMGSTEIAYTAVPVKTWRRYQQLAADHARMVLMHDWVRTILQWAKTHKLDDATLIVLHPKGLDVVVLSEGRVRALERLQTFQEEGNAWERLGQRVVSVVGELDDADRTGPSMLMQSALLLVCAGADSQLLTIVQGLSPIVVTEMWSESPDATRASLPDALWPVQQLDWTSVAQSIPLRQAANPHWTRRRPGPTAGSPWSARLRFSSHASSPSQRVRCTTEPNATWQRFPAIRKNHKRFGKRSTPTFSRPSNSPTNKKASATGFRSAWATPICQT